MKLSALLLFLFFISSSLDAKNKIYIPEIDSITSVNHIDIIDLIDSLYFSTLDYKNPIKQKSGYIFSSDSIPIYDDKVYMERMHALNVVSPFDLQFNEDVKNYILYFTKRQSSMISRVLAMQSLYFPIFEELLDKYQLPQELKYLAIVESSLNTNATSRAGAVGLWQFMPGTGQDYGLTCNSKLDDRRNVWAATDAACRHFVNLYNVYHDWNLVLAAYNSGAGNVNKAIKRADSITDYWTIRQYLPGETRNYVPIFIANNYMMNYSMEHNIPKAYFAIDNFNSLDTLYINEKYTFQEISDLIDIPVSKLELMNPQYRKDVIPASESNKFMLTLPVDKISEFLKYKKEVVSSLTSKEFETAKLVDSK